MIVAILIILVILSLGGMGIWFAYKYYKRRLNKSIEQLAIPKEIMTEFNKVEQLLKGGIKEDGTTTSPYQILWDIARDNRHREANRNIGRTESPTDNRELSPKSNGGQDIQSRNPTSIDEDKSINRKSNSNNIRSFIHNLRRKNRGSE